MLEFPLLRLSDDDDDDDDDDDEKPEFDFCHFRQFEQDKRPQRVFSGSQSD